METTNDDMATLFNTVPKEGSYFSDMTKSPEQTVLEMRGIASTDALGEPVEVVEAVKSTDTNPKIIVKPDIDYKVEYEKSQNSYKELRSLKDKQINELGDLRKENEGLMQTFENTFDIAEDGKTPVIKREYLDRFGASHPHSTDDEFMALIEKDDFRGAVRLEAKKIAAEEMGKTMKDLNELKAWRDEQLENNKWDAVSNTLQNQVADLEKDEYFNKCKEGVLSVLNESPQLYEYVDNPIKTAYEIYKGRANFTGKDVMKEGPSADTFAGETGRSSPQPIDPHADFKRELRESAGTDILALVGLK